MTQPIWSFRRLLPGPRRDPFEDEFFSGNDDASEAYDRTDFLVRESVQNALDAKNQSHNGPVKVRFGVRTGNAALAADDAKPFLRGLVEHLTALKNDVLQMSHAIPPMSYVIYEDFGTRGLCGNPMQASDPDPNDNESHDFYWFWWNVGRSGKRGTDLGRWGLGKTVFPSASRISAQFGLTVRAVGAQPELLMGQAITRIHRLPDGKEYQPEGYFCIPGGSDQLDKPIDDPEWLERFKNVFGLKRGTDPGLSIVVPYCYEAIDAVDITRSVILHWFFPILRGDLIVEVSGPDRVETIINATSIREVAKRLAWKGNRAEKKHQPPPFDLAEWAIGREAAGIDVELKLAGVSTIPVWSEDLFHAGQLDTLRKKFADRERIAVRVPMTTERKTGEKPETFFEVFIEQDDELSRGEDLFIRAGMTISRISTLGPQRGVRGLVVVSDQELSGLLGDAEGPAHEDWKSTERRPDRRYVKWARRLTFVKQSLVKLVQMLTPPPAGLDEDLLGDIFNIADTSKRGPKKKGKSKKPAGNAANPPPPEFKAVPKWWRVTQTTGGFRIRKSSELAVPSLPRKLHISVAYDLPDGNPLRNWSKFDFSFNGSKDNPIQFAGKGVKIANQSDNRLDLDIEQPDFLLEVSGFDRFRDLYVRTTEDATGISVDAPSDEKVGEA